MDTGDAGRDNIRCLCHQFILIVWVIDLHVAVEQE
jgi:hypothetical protein